MYNDKNLTCADCGQEFVFTASEQDFYAQRGFTEPRRCPSCRASRKAARNAEGGGSSYGGYGAGGGYSAGGSQLRRRRWWLRLPRPRPPRDVHRDLLVLRQGGPGPVPPDQRQARLLQRLLPQPARRLTQSSRRGPTTARRTSVIPDPGRQPTRVVRFSGPTKPSALKRWSSTRSRRAASGAAIRSRSAHVRPVQSSPTFVPASSESLFVERSPA